MAVIISSSMVLGAPLEVPLTHARIGYQSMIQESTTVLAATSEAVGFDINAIKEYNTYEYWQATSTDEQIISITPSPSTTANYLGISTHNLGTIGATLSLQYSEDNSTWVTIEAFVVADDSARMVLFSDFRAPFWRVVLSGMSAPPTIGVMFLGKVLAMQRAIYQGHTPINLSRQTELRPTKSEGGQWLGRSVIRKAIQTSYSWSNLKADWYRANFDPFVEAALTQPFFIAWRPETYPLEVAYAWTSGDIAPTNSGPKDYMSVGFSVVAQPDGV